MFSLLVQNAHDVESTLSSEQTCVSKCLCCSVAITFYFLISDKIPWSRVLCECAFHVLTASLPPSTFGIVLEQQPEATVESRDCESVEPAVRWSIFGSFRWIRMIGLLSCKRVKSILRWRPVGDEQTIYKSMSHFSLYARHRSPGCQVPKRALGYSSSTNTKLATPSNPY